MENSAIFLIMGMTLMLVVNLTFRADVEGPKRTVFFLAAFLAVVAILATAYFMPPYMEVIKDSSITIIVYSIIDVGFMLGIVAALGVLLVIVLVSSENVEFVDIKKPYIGLSVAYYSLMSVILLLLIVA